MEEIEENNNTNQEIISSESNSLPLPLHESDCDSDSNSAAPSLSKNQLKKLRKTQRWEEAKARKKEQKKAQKRKHSEEISINQKENESNESRDHLIERQVLKQQRKEEFQEKCKGNFGIVIDCGWEDQHTDSTLKSLTQQIMFCYGLNRKYDKPSRLFITGVGPRTTALLSKNNSQHWISASIHSNDFPEVLESYYKELQESDHLRVPVANPLQNVIYLTSDATDILEELDNNCIYVIGGIVDRNRLKGATFNKAQQLHVRAAKLPIKEHMKMAATHVLTVNHVFDILKQYAECHSWPEAIEKVLPPRKGAQVVPNESEDGGDEKGESLEVEEVDRIRDQNES